MINHIKINGCHFYNVTAEDLLSFGVEQNVIDAAINKVKWDEIRVKRDGLIFETDKEYFRHYRELRNGKEPDDEANPTTLTSAQLSELDAYVQTLANIPQTYTNPDDVVWPSKPTL